MEMSEDGFLQELLALRRETWEANPATDQINGLFSTITWPFDGLDSLTPASILPNTFSTIDHTTLDCSSSTEFYLNPSGPLIHTEPSGPGPVHHSDPAQYPVSSSSTLEAGGLDRVQGTCKAEPMNRSKTSSSISKSKNKKIEGQPSKNLMAERRRRKRLNDRLSMLRSVVPKITKLDRTSILGDTIDYMKELLESINNLQEEIDVGSASNQLDVLSIFKDVKTNDVLVRNSPKFDVERRNLDTRVEICCEGKPGLLLSTVATLEGLGLEIKQCVISCFNDLALQASCSEEMERSTFISSEEIKQTLLRNAGYGGRCL